MTREKAKDKIHRHVGNGLSVAMKTVDEIYDNFENRTCENCKHFSIEHKISDKLYGICVIGVAQLPNDYSTRRHVPDNINNGNFGCNKWEGK